MKTFTKSIKYHHIILVMVLLMCAFAEAQLKNDFDPRFNEAVNGDFTMIANNMVSTTATGDYNDTGVGSNNQDNSLVYVDIDGFFDDDLNGFDDTFNSSRAEFKNPSIGTSCLTIKKVILYWAASDFEPIDGDLNSENQANWDFDDIKLMLPGQTNYVDYDADEVIYRGRDDNGDGIANDHFSNDPYICVKDITTLVTDLVANGDEDSAYGQYQVANVEGKIDNLTEHGFTTPTGVSAGWQIVFVYESPLLPLKNISIYDGYGHVRNLNGSRDYDITITGFQTVPTPQTVSAKIITGGLEGDRDLNGDKLQIETTPNNFVDLSTSPTAPIRDSNNFFNSRITVDNANFLDRAPASQNTSGFDAAIFQLSNPSNSIIGNGQTSATFRLTSNQETYGVYLLGLSVDIFEPNLGPIEVLTTASSTPQAPGSTIVGSFDVENKGNDDAVNVKIFSTLPPQLTVEFPILGLPPGVSATYVGNYLEFTVDNEYVEAGDPAIENVDFNLIIRDECYFLEDTCDLSFGLEFTATYNGVINPDQQTTNSSSSLDPCGVGNNEETIINVIQPTISWQTPSGSLDRTVQCNDATALAAAQALEPVANKCNLTPIKTSGTFVPDPICPNAGTYTNTWNFTDACGVTISDFEQVITVANNPPTGTTPAGTTGINACASESEIDTIVTTATDIAAIEAAYTGGCGTVTVSFVSQTLTGDACNWSLERTYNISDECPANDFTVTITHTGSDQDAATGTTPSGTTDINACANEFEIDIIVTKASDIAALQTSYTDDCGTVTAAFVSQSLTGDACNWSLERTYNISDGCLANDFTVTITHTGSDQDPAMGTTPTGTTAINACASETEIDTIVTTATDIAAIEAAYTDDCGTVTATFASQTLTGDACSWSLERTYTISDGCPANNFDVTITHTGSDQDAATGTTPAGTTAINACASESEIDTIVTTATDIAAIEAAYTDDCGTVTATFANQTLTGDACSWSLERTYTISDGCPANNFDVTITHTGSDQDAATGTTPAGTTAINACASETEIDTIVTTVTDIAAIEAAYTDDCGTVTATFASQTLTGDACSWSLERTYTISDGCPANNFDVTITHTGSDQDAATGTTPAGTTAINACASESEIDTIVTTANDIAAIEAAYTDDCGTVTATFASQTLTGDACNWSLERTYTISDGCPANNFDVTITHTGSDQDAATGITPAGTTAINACASESEIDTIVTTATDIAAIEAAYTDDCGTVTATFASQTLTGDACNWSLERTYTISDGCPANNFDVTITHTGSDQDAATGTTPAGTTGINACASESEIDTIVTTATDIAAIEAAYTDDCGTVTATFASQTLTGDACSWSLERTYTISDGCPANNFDVTITHTGSDQDAATGTTPAGTTAINACASETEIGTIVNATDIAAIEAAYTDDCGTVTATFASQTLTGDACSWSLERTYTISDGCPANNFDVTITHTGSDQDAATGTTPAGTTAINACASESEIDTIVTTATDIAAIEAAYTDDCGTVTATFASQALTGDACNWSLERTYTISDGCPANNFDVTITHTGSDQDAATGTTPAGTTAINACASETEIDTIVTTVTDIAAIEAAYTDDCGTVTATFANQTLTGDACSWSLERTYTISDGCPANNFDVTITHTGSDQDAATGTTPAGTTAINACASETEIDTIVTTVTDIAAIEAAYTDDCGTVTATFASQTLTGDACSWSLERTYTISDGCPANNFDVTITHTGSDQDAATGTTPAGTTAINACASESEIDTIVTTANDIAAIEAAYTDDCGTVTATFASQTLTGDACSWSLERTYTISDGCPANNFDVTITHTGSDQTNPAIDNTNTANIEIECGVGDTQTLLTAWLDSNAGATATDNCGTITWSNDYGSDDSVKCDNGAITVTFTATDDCNNMSTTTATYLVKDNTPPTVDTAAGSLDATLECSDTAGISAALSLVPTASDDCSTPAITLVSDVTTADANCANAYVQIRTWNFTDGCNNTSADFVQTITVQDNTAPIVDTAAGSLDATLECSDTTNINAALALAPTATDNCTAAPNMVLVSDVTTADANCANAYVQVRTWNFTDGCNNTSADFVQTITVQDNTAPIVDTAAGSLDATLECSDTTNINAALALAPTATDNCTAAPNMVLVSDVTTADANCANAYVQVRTWNFTDGCGNVSADFVQTITVQDNTAPIVDTAAGSLDATLECSDTTNINAALALAPTATDNCTAAPNMVLVSDVTTVDPTCPNAYVQVRTWNFTDGCGNTSANFVQTITVQDNTAPAIDNTNTANIEIECGVGDTQTLLTAWLDSNAGATATDNCGTITWSNDYGSDDSVKCDNGAITVTFTATDDCNNMSTTTATYLVKDNTPPTVDTAAGSLDATLECSDTAGISAALSLVPTASDDCSTPAITLVSDVTTADANCANAYVQIRTWNFTDGCNNTSADFVQTITVQDNTAPIVDTAAGSLDATLECSDTSNINAALALAPTATDNCTAAPNMVLVSDVTTADANCANAYVQVRTWNFTDGCNNTSADFVQTITVQDNTAPIVDTAAGSLDATLECSDTTNINAALALAPTATDNCTAAPNMVLVSDVTTADANCANAYVQVRTWNFTDGCGNVSADFVQTITVQDNTAPIVDTAAGSLDATLECSDTTNINAALALAPTATDNCTAAPNMVLVSDVTTVDPTCPNAYVQVRTWNFTDGCGNTSANFVQTITVQDNTAPAIDNTNTANIEIECGVGDTQTLLTAWLDSNAGATATDNCGTITWSNDYGSDDSVKCDNGAITVTFTATDDCNNMSTTTATYLVKDNTPPTIDTAAGSLDATLECSDTAGISAALSLVPTASDDCSTPAITLVSDVTTADANCANAYVQVRTWNFTDGCNNTSADFVQTITVQDNTAPIVDTAAGSLDATLECSDTTNINAALALAPTATDNCTAAPNMVLVSDVTTADANCANAYVQIRTWNFTDGCNNTSADFVQTITVQDNTAPIVDTAAGSLDATLECSDTTNINAALALAPTATDNCTAAPNMVLVSDVNTVDPTCPNAYVQVRTWNFTDGCGNTSANFVQTITVQDNTAPVIDNTNTANIEIECGVSDLQTVITAWLDSNAGATATDNCGNVTWSNDYGSDDSVKCDNGAITVTFTATDDCNNTSTTTATYLIKDNTVPTVDTAAGNLDATLECSDTAGISAALSLVPTASDDCSTPVITLVSDVTTADANCANAYVQVRTWNFTDSCGNVSADFVQTITVQDTTAPIVNTAAGSLDATLECSDTGGLTNALAQGPTATDNCSATSNIILVSDLTTPDANCPNAYVQVRTWNFTDGCGNTSTNFVQTIIVQDNTAPVLTLPANVTAECSDDLTPSAFGTATATDNCDSDPVISFSDVTTNGTCPGSFTITRTWTATDACGNVTSDNQIISTSDTTAPEFDQTTLPANVVVECDNIPAEETLTATDNCGNATVTVNDVRTDGNCPSNYTIARSYTATDDCGITNTHVQIITVQDTTPPMFVESLPMARIVVECDAVPTAETLTATDICNSASVTVSDSRTDGNCPNNYTLVRTWTAMDECGLTTTHTQIITVQDTTAPEFVETLPRDTTVECDAIPDVTTLTATDNCGTATVTINDVRTDGNCPSNYTIARTWTAKDECGLETKHTQVITVQDTTAPVPTTSFEETMDVSCTDVPDAPVLEFEDNCSSNVIVEFNETNSFDENNLVDYQIVRTWTVRDACNNEEVYTQTLNVALDEVFSEIVAEDRCFDEGIYDLNVLISDTLNTDGVWELLEGNPDATLTGSIFDPTVLELSEDFLPDDGGVDYRFRYTTTHEGCISITEVIMNINADCVVLPCGENDIEISTAITPNGDGFNDTFDIAGIDLCGFTVEVKIFNRWGALVYDSKNYTLGSIKTSGAKGDWDGTPTASFGGKSKLPNGTYYYIIKLQNSGLSPLTGPVYLGTK